MKNKKIYFWFLLTATFLMTFFLPALSVSAQNEALIIDFELQDAAGNPLDKEVGMWTAFRIEGNFEILNNRLHLGDTTTIQLPNTLKFANTIDFEVKDSLGELVASASIYPDSKTIVLTYTDYVEKYTNIKGTFFFYALVDYSEVPDKNIISIDLEIDGEKYSIGEIDYTGPTTPDQNELSKAGWFDFTQEKVIHYSLEINHSKIEMKNIIIEDEITTPQVTIDPNTIVIMKGNWVWDFTNYRWTLENKVVVTDQYPIQVNVENNKFIIDLGNIESEEGFLIQYLTTINFNLKDGDTITNNANLSYDNISSPVNNGVVYYHAGGIAEKDDFVIKIYKHNENGEPLEGAQFIVAIKGTNEKIGTITTDSYGIGELGGLVKNEYIIKEIVAPLGYNLSEEEIYISSKDFERNLEVFIKVLNTKSFIKVPKTSSTSNVLGWGFCSLLCLFICLKIFSSLQNKS